MKYNKQSAFTLAEVLVLLLTITILIAAFAPVFTKRYTGGTSENVWHFVPGDDESNAYYDSASRVDTATAFIGLSPLDSEDVNKMLNYNDSTSSSQEIKPVHSKLVIAAADRVNGYNYPQYQMQFRHDSSSDNSSPAGQLIASLFAGNGNLLLGGFSSLYKSSSGYPSQLTNNANDNTSLGFATLSFLKDADENTVVGAYSLFHMGRDGGASESSGNTVYGAQVATNMRKGKGNTMAGSMTAFRTSGSGNYNTIMGPSTQRAVDYANKTGAQGGSGKGSYNTVVGLDNLVDANAAPEGNTAVGYSALFEATGKYNTALGSNSLPNLRGGDYNTAIGYNSCSFLGKDENGKALNNVTCIGANSGATLGTESSNGLHEEAGHVYIGGKPKHYIQSAEGTAPRAVLEVHTASKKVKTSGSNDNEDTGLNNWPSPSGNESVVINGNLIVKGNTYLEVPIVRPHMRLTDPRITPKGLVYFRLVAHKSPAGLVFSGDDGRDRMEKTLGYCRGGPKQRAFDSVNSNCICTSVGDFNFGHKNDKLVTSYGAQYRLGIGNSYNGNYVAFPSYSYDWFTPTVGKSSFGENMWMIGPPGEAYSEWGQVQEADYHENNCYTQRYTDQSTGKTVYMYNNPYGYASIPGGQGFDYASRYVDRSFSHFQIYSSCCPNLTSDIRLKNVGVKFVAGLDEIRKINVYNFTFKTDKNRVPQVGVIAQDLKRVFPNAVSKDEKGYYQIRWDEMLYAAINAIKTLNSKVEKLADKIVTDKERIANLKADNAKMYAQLDKLAEELDQLEAKSRK